MAETHISTSPARLNHKFSQACPIEFFPILEPQNPPIHIFELNKIPRSANFAVLKL